MKYLLFLLIVNSFALAQSPIVPLTTSMSNSNAGTYFKDINNDMNAYSGTWQYSQNGKIITITLQKKQMVFDGEFYEDLLIGEYRYEDNGTIVVNTLPNLSNPAIQGRDHLISGRQIVPKNMFPICSTCAQNEKRFKLHFHDSERDYLSVYLIVRIAVGVDGFQLLATLAAEDGVILPTENSPTQTRLPYGNYVLDKL